MDKVHGPTQSSFPTTYSPKNDGFEFDDRADDFERMLEDSNLFDEENNQIQQQGIHDMSPIKTESI